MDAQVFGQTHAKQALALALYRSALSVATGKNEFGSSHVLMVGPTGVGKSALVRVAAERMLRPVFSVDCSSLVPPGIVGATVQSTLSALITFCGSRERAEQAILFLDEFDKLGMASSLDRGLEVQASLLPLLDGSALEVGFASRTDEARSRFATKDLIIVCAGAFTGLDAIVQKRMSGGHAIGFGAARLGGGKTLWAGLEPTDLSALGFMPEILGRLRSVVALEPLRATDLEAILDLDAPTAALRQAKQWFAAHGTELVLDRGAKQAIAARALQRGLGARALQGTLTQVLAPIEDLVCNSDQVIERVVVTRLSVTRARRPKLVYAEEENKRWHHHTQSFQLRIKGAAGPATLAVGSPTTNTADWSKDQLKERLDTLKETLQFGASRISTRNFWRDMEQEEGLRMALLMAEELLARELTIDHFAYAAQASGTTNHAALAYLDFLRAASRLPSAEFLRAAENPHVQIELLPEPHAENSDA